MDFFRQHDIQTVIYHFRLNVYIKFNGLRLIPEFSKFVGIPKLTNFFVRLGLRNRAFTFAHGSSVQTASYPAMTI